jgi:TonB family protein
MGRSAVLSLLVHAAAIVFVLVMPETFMQPPHRIAAEPVVTPLIEPRLELTQKEPNTGKLIKEFHSADLTPRVKAPAGPSPEPEAAAPRKPVAPPPPKAAPQTPLPEPPKLEIATTEQPKLTLPVQPPQVPRPRSTPAFEDVEPTSIVPPGQRVMETPGPSVANAIRGALRGPGINVPGTAQVPSTGAELPQLLSDPQGVDFRPYLAEVLAAVKRYWLATLPPSAKAGRRGNVSVQFAIERDGSVGKVSFAQQTGDLSMDNAAVMAISGGGPFGPLPAQYRGGEIHLQMSFAYNVPKR